MQKASGTDEAKPGHYCRLGQILASFPGPAQLSVTSSRVKRGRGPGIFSHVSDVRIERIVERV